jgi:D-serine deaminase-like pyridoxal phosphate-dependent protein
MVEQAEDISRVARNRKREVPVLVKIDTGVDRYGVLPGEPTLALVNRLSRMPGLKFIGIYAHESGLNIAKGIEQGALEVASAMCETAQMLTRQGFKPEIVGVGASPTFRTMCQYLKEERFPEITEIHPGALYVGDITHVRDGANTLDTCALTVLASVQSTSHLAHAVIDTGFKTFGADAIIAKRDTPGFFWKGRPSWGYVRNRSDLWFGRSTAERGLLYYKEDATRDIKIGDRFEIIPNNATIVVNIHSTMYGVRNGKIEKVIQVTGREKGS